jgi:hypothetical protein
MNKVFVGFPHGVMLYPGALVAASQATVLPVMARATGNSVLCQNFNMLWCDALNHRKTHGVTHFAMCHYDVRPEPFWVDKLIAEMDRVDADIISTVLAIKDDRGLTSTGIASYETSEVRRLTMHEVFDLPETFSVADTGGDYLAVNTGLWVARLESWTDRFYGFETRTGISEQPDGTFKAWFRPEDWLMSEQAYQLGLRVYATRAVKAWHCGVKEYGNDEPWGDWAFDHDNVEEVIRDNSGLAGSRHDSCSQREQQQHIHADQ